MRSHHAASHTKPLSENRQLKIPGHKQFRGVHSKVRSFHACPASYRGSACRSILNGQRFLFQCFYCDALVSMKPFKLSFATLSQQRFMQCAALVNMGAKPTFIDLLKISNREGLPGREVALPTLNTRDLVD